MKFDQDEDRNKLVNGGPWRIFYHYLCVRTWSEDFNAGSVTIDKSIV